MKHLYTILVIVLLCLSGYFLSEAIVNSETSQTYLIKIALGLICGYLSYISLVKSDIK